jgi:hypothetical protein
MSAPNHAEDELVDYDEDAGAQTLEPEKKAAPKAKEVTRSIDDGRMSNEFESQLHTPTPRPHPPLRHITITIAASWPDRSGSEHARRIDDRRRIVVRGGDGSTPQPRHSYGLPFIRLIASRCRLCSLRSPQRFLRRYPVRRFSRLPPEAGVATRHHRLRIRTPV